MHIIDVILQVLKLLARMCRHGGEPGQCGFGRACDSRAVISNGVLGTELSTALLCLKSESVCSLVRPPRGPGVLSCPV
jgi:hypothetical protein